MIWLNRLLWLTLPITLGDVLADALEDRSTAVTAVATVLAWGLWAAGLLTSLVRAPWALVALRTIAPLSVVAGAVAAVSTAPGLLGWIGIATAAVASVAAMSAEVGNEFINGASYGDEQRFPLRPPAVLLLGPIAAVWGLTALPLPAAALALAAQQWLLGAALGLGGAAAAWWGVKVLTRLTRRWCVLVPAGLTLVDDMAIVDATLMRSGDIVSIGPAPADTDALDLSAGATGLIVQVDLGVEIDVTPVVARNAVAETVTAASILIAPSRPGALIRAAHDRGVGAQRA